MREWRAGMPAILNIAKASYHPPPAFLAREDSRMIEWKSQ
jgi:hypothetical protein